MKITLPIIFIFLLLSSVFAYSQEKVYGGFRECSVYTTAYEKNKLIAESRHKEFYYKYDDKGNKTEDVLCTYEGGINTQQIFSYDSKGNITEEKGFAGDGKMIWHNTCKYDDKARKIETTSISIMDSTIDYYLIHEYDDKGNMIKEIRKNPDGSITSVDSNLFDSRGNILFTAKFQTYGGNELLPSEMVKYERKYKYDDKGRILEMTDRFYDFNNPARILYKYDEFGNLSEKIEYSSPKELHLKKEYFYTK